MATVVKSMTDMMRNTPLKYFSSVATRHLDGERLELGPNMTTDRQNLGDVDQARENLALGNGPPCFPARQR